MNEPHTVQHKQDTQRAQHIPSERALVENGVLAYAWRIKSRVSKLKRGGSNI